MTDSIAVLPPGWRALDNNGRIITQATLHFYDTDGVTPKEVFSDADLSISLGTTVQCNSGGYPVSDADARVIVYTGSDPYNVQLRDGANVTVWSHENVRGAVDTSQFLSAVGMVAASPVVGVASNTTRTTDDAGKLINANTTGGTITTTLPSAVDAGNGFRIGVRHGGTANQHIIKATAGSFLGVAGNATVTQVALSEPGESMWFVSNGTNWHLDTYVPPLRNTVGVIHITDWLSSPPSNPPAGSRYLVASNPTGAWSSFSEHDIAEYTGSGWFKITPPTDCGWIAYIKDDGWNYQFRNSSWSGMQEKHPATPKFWATVGDDADILASYNVTSATDHGQGDVSLSFGTDFKSGFWCCVATCQESASSQVIIAHVHSKAAGSVRVQAKNESGNLEDPDGYNIVGFGEQ